MILRFFFIQKFMNNIEKNELDILLQKGVSFEVETTIYVRKKGLLGYLSKREKKTEIKKFIIKQPTLSVLDRFSSEAIDLVLDESVLSSETGISEAKKIASLQAKRLAKILAIFVLGQDYRVVNRGGSYFNNDKELDDLTDLFYNNITPSKIMQLCMLINTMSNLGDFINSIRLMSASRTTMPNRIEQQEA